MPDASSRGDARAHRRILAALPEKLTASAGVAMWDGRETAIELQRRADRAMYAAKRGGKGHARLAAAGDGEGDRNPRLAAGMGAS